MHIYLYVCVLSVLLYLRLLEMVVMEIVRNLYHELQGF